MIMTDKKIQALRINPEAAKRLLLADFRLFVSVFHWYMHREQFTFKPFHKRIIGKLQDIAFGRNEKTNLYIGIAPRFGKSQLTIYFIAYGFALNPKSNFIHTSYGSDLVAKFSAEIRSIVSSDLFQEIFGLFVDQSTSAKDLWKIENGGEFRATSLNGVITGFGAGTMEDGWGGALMIDDFMKAADYRSETLKNTVIDLYENTLKSRRNNKRTPIIIIAQRLAKDDLIGYIKEHEPENWDFYIEPTYYEDENGQPHSIWEEKMPTSELLEMKEKNPFKFNAQYQQEPVVLGGGMIKHEWWRYYDKDYQTEQFKRFFITADTAFKTNEWNDYTAIGVWGMTSNNRLYLIDLLHGKFEAPELETMFMALWNKWNKTIQGRGISAVYIEDKASGTGLIQSLKRKGGLPIIGILPNSDKRTRVMEAIPQIAAGNVLLPFSENSDISKKVLAETDAFSEDMSHEHDDIVDMVCYAIQYGFSQRGLF